MEWLIVVAFIAVMLLGFLPMQKVDAFREILRRRKEGDDGDE
ncbi:MAG: hypothetical protein PUJ55_08400 [Clostridiales bacterium]|nr:hypothetical protein [Clostridiales bacterium]MDY4111273.1 hypothetical protein [Roseburia sp.]